MDRNCQVVSPELRVFWSLSARRAWIEMQVFQRIAKPFRVALRKESVDRNYCRTFVLGGWGRSLSARRAWIEITAHTAKKTSMAGSLSARRAWIEMCNCIICDYCAEVALRKESVDRNRRTFKRAITGIVALRKESVDRNSLSGGTEYDKAKSLSARRAWIEIWLCGRLNMLTRSLSARRAWIEMRTV